MNLSTSKWLVGVLIGCLPAAGFSQEEDIIHLRCETQAKIYDKRKRENSVTEGFFHRVPLVVDRFRKTMWVDSYIRIPLQVTKTAYKINHSAADVGSLRVVINRETGGLEAHHVGPRFVRDEKGRCHRYKPAPEPSS